MYIYIFIERKEIYNRISFCMAFTLGLGSVGQRNMEAWQSVTTSSCAQHWCCIYSRITKRRAHTPRGLREAADSIASLKEKEKKIPLCFIV